MLLKVAKEYLHVRDWLTRAQEIVGAGKEAYDANPLLQEAGDSLMMKIGEAASRLDRAGVAAPKGHAWSDAVGNRKLADPSVRPDRSCRHMVDPDHLAADVGEGPPTLLLSGVPGLADFLVHWKPSDVVVELELRKGRWRR